MRSDAEISVLGKIERNGPRMGLSSCLHILFVCAASALRVPVPDHALLPATTVHECAVNVFACCARFDNGGDYRHA